MNTALCLFTLVCLKVATSEYRDIIHANGKSWAILLNCSNRIWILTSRPMRTACFFSQLIGQCSTTSQTSECAIHFIALPTLSKYLQTTLSEYLQTWRLKLSHTKTVTAVFHLHNREAKRELKVCNIGKTLPFCSIPTYLGVKLDRSLTYHPHLEALRKKLCARVELLRRFAGTDWGASAKTMRTAALSMVYSTAEYCAPVWCRSAHTRLIDSVLNDALRIVAGCLRPTPSVYLRFLQASSQLSFAAKERHSP